MSHTPGPWEIDKRLSGYEVKAKDKNLWVCSVYGNSDNVDEADARLIAAAPDLLEALEELYHLIDDSHDGDRVYTFELAQKARAAIAKARGQS